MVETILYSFPHRDDYMDDIFHRQSRRQSCMNQPTEKPTNYALMMTETNHLPADHISSTTT